MGQDEHTNRLDWQLLKAARGLVERYGVSKIGCRPGNDPVLDGLVHIRYEQALKGGKVTNEMKEALRRALVRWKQKGLLNT